MNAQPTCGWSRHGQADEYVKNDIVVSRQSAAGCAGGTDVTLLAVNGGGHTWPAGRFALPENIVGTNSFAVDASQASGQFFAAH